MKFDLEVLAVVFIEERAKIDLSGLLLIINIRVVNVGYEWLVRIGGEDLDYGE